MRIWRIEESSPGLGLNPNPVLRSFFPKILGLDDAARAALSASASTAAAGATATGAAADLAPIAACATAPAAADSADH